MINVLEEYDYYFRKAQQCVIDAKKYSSEYNYYMAKNLYNDAQFYYLESAMKAKLINDTEGAKEAEKLAKECEYNSKIMQKFLNNIKTFSL